MSLRRRGYLVEQRNSHSRKSVAHKPRGKPTAPFKHLLDKDLLRGRVLDYGCGKGVDAEKLGIHRYDPHYFPKKPEGLFDTIVCNYVLNVVKDRRGRGIIKRIKALLKPGGVAYLTVRADVSGEGFTKRQTFQRDVKLKLPVEHKTGWYRMYRLEK